jgi:hypothetical protein
VIPMMEASEALEFVEEFLNLVAKSAEDDQPTLSASSWEFLAVRVFDSRLKLDAAVKRVTGTLRDPDVGLSGIVIPLDPPLDMVRMSTMFHEREAREAAALDGVR